MCTTQVALNDSGHQPPVSAARNLLEANHKLFCIRICCLRDLKPGALGSNPGNCQLFTFLCFSFTTSKHNYLQLKQDVLKIIMNIVVTQIATTIHIPTENSPGLFSLPTSVSNTAFSPDASGFVQIDGKR